MEKSEQEMIRGLLKNEKYWLRQFHDQYRQRLFNFVLQKIDDPRDAEEIVQDTLVAAIYSLPSFLGKSCLWTWLCGIAKHEAADFYRKRRIKTILFSRFPFLETLASRALSPEIALEEKEIKQKIFRVFSALNEGYREVLRLKYIEGLSLREIANRWEKSVKAIEMRLRRARHAFVDLWENQELDQNWNFNFDQGDLSFLEELLGSFGSSLPDD
jgi:RNA polymerase sigma-70 factor (ECF subfamily)